jgi:hypothetical protein
MKNFPGVKFGTDSKNWWGKNEITQYYTCQSLVNGLRFIGVSFVLEKHKSGAT